MTIRQILVVASIMFAGLAIWLGMPEASAQKPMNREWKDPHQAIETKAHLAKVEDETSIRALADEVFNSPHAYRSMPSYIESMVKDRLVQAEISYRQDTRSGVHEDDVVKLINSIGSKLNAPEYARTSLHQVRVMRMSLALSTPYFMGKGMTHDGMKIGESVDPIMSPLQAVHLIATIVDQKFLNPEYQVTVDEYERSFYQKNAERLQRLQSLERAGTLKAMPVQAKVSVRENTKGAELNQVISQGASSLSTTDVLNLVDQAFTTLKIK